MFCEGVQHRLQVCLDHLSCVKIVTFQFYFQFGKQRNRVGVDDNHVSFGQKFPGEKRKCEIVCCCDSIASSFVVKIWGEVFTHFCALTVKHHSSMQTLLSGLPERILCEQFDVNENDEHALDFAHHLFSPFFASVSLDFLCMAYASFPEHLSNHARVSAALFPRFAQNLILFLCQIHRQIHYSK
jgi:hypothetical protein